MFIYAYRVDGTFELLNVMTLWLKFAGALYFKFLQRLNPQWFLVHLISELRLGFNVSSDCSTDLSDEALSGGPVFRLFSYQNHRGDYLLYLELK